MTNNLICRKPLFGLTCALTLLGSLFSVSNACAQERWYQIEVIAFANQSAEEEEHWPHNIKLDYPLRWVELQVPYTPPADAESEAEETAEPQETLEAAAQVAFQLLAADEHRLNTQAKKLANSRHYRVLFHEAWRQPLGAASTAKGVLIFGGETFGEHRELEGSIIFSLGRLVEAKAKLWLTEFEVDQGQAPGDWPLLPKSPIQRTASFNLLTSEPEPGAWSEEGETAEEQQPVWGEVSQTAEIEPEVAYLPRRIVLLEEDRRLRTNEIHYLDHPLMGVILLVTPYQPAP
jgi:hypothetical protein